jgi:hypothetical protein
MDEFDTYGPSLATMRVVLNGVETNGKEDRRHD